MTKDPVDPNLKVCLHVPSPSPCPSPSTSNLHCVCGGGPFDGQNGFCAHFSIRQSVSIDIMINFNGDGDGHGLGDGMCKKALRFRFSWKSVG